MGSLCYCHFDQARPWFKFSKRTSSVAGLALLCSLASTSAKKISSYLFCTVISSALVIFVLWLLIRELKNHDDDFVDDDRKCVTVHCASATNKFCRRGVVDDAKQSRITSSCNPQASAGINPLFLSDFWRPLHFCILVNPGILSFFS